VNRRPICYYPRFLGKTSIRFDGLSCFYRETAVHIPPVRSCLHEQRCYRIKNESHPLGCNWINLRLVSTIYGRAHTVNSSAHTTVVCSSRVRNLRIALVCLETNSGKLDLAQHSRNVPDPKLRHTTRSSPRRWRFDWSKIICEPHG